MASEVGAPTVVRGTITEPVRCRDCKDKGFIETGNNDLPCHCPAGDSVVINDAEYGQLQGKAWRKLRSYDEPGVRVAPERASLAGLELRLSQLEQILHGVPDPNADNQNVPRPAPTPPGLITKIDRVMYFLGIDPATARRRFQPSTSMDGVIADAFNDRFAYRARRAEDERISKTLRGRIRGLLQRAITLTYPRERHRDHGESQVAEVVDEAGLGSLGGD